MDDSSSGSSGSDSGAGKKKKASSNPQEAKEGEGMDASNSAVGRMTPFARIKLQQQEKEAQLYLDFCEFASRWLQPSGCVQKHMVVLYFREHYDNSKYKYSSSAEDRDIEDAFDKWNQEEGPKAEANEFGLYLGVQINTEYEREVRIKHELDRRKTQIKLIISESKRTGLKPPLEVLKEAMDLGVIQVPQATLESMKAVSARPPRRVTMAAPPQVQHDSPKQKKKRVSASRLGKSMGDLDFKSADRKERKTSKDKTKDKDKDKDKERKTSSKSSSSSRMHKSMGNLDYKPSSSSGKSEKSEKEEKKEKKKSSHRDKERLGKSMGDLDYEKSRKTSSKDKDKDKKTSSRDKDDKKSSSKDKDHKSSKSSSSRLHKSMGTLDYKSSSRDKDKDKEKDKDRKSSTRDKDDKSKDKDRKSSSKDKDKDKSSSKDKDKKSSSRDKDKDKDKKSNSKDKDRKSSSKDKEKEKDKEKKSSSRKSSRRGSH